MTFSTKLKKNLKPQYTNNLVDEFYKPLLNEANLYQRVSGYFNSAGMDLYSDGLEELAKNNGEVQFIISKEISSDDYSRIKKGYDLKEEISSLNLAAQYEKLNTQAQQKLGNLAFMIAASRARVKVALTKNGIFHDKFGIISSGQERVFFNGSANETKSGISSNYESISVDVSWDDSENVKKRIESNAERFNRLWNNQEENVEVFEASELTYNEIAKFKEQASIKTIATLPPDTLEDRVADTIQFKYIDERIVRVDNTASHITDSDRKLKKDSDLGSYFEDNNSTFVPDVTYTDVEKVILVTKERAKRASRKGNHITVSVSPALTEFLTRNKYSISQYKILGDVYKGNIDDFPSGKKEQFAHFEQIVQNEVSRPLRPQHLRAAYYEYEMERAANFSVPGAGKTAMLLGVFAYLNSSYVSESEKVDRMLVISPINAFDSWKKEFKKVFADKKDLKVIDSQSSKNIQELLSTDWQVNNLVLINYEALSGVVNQLTDLLDKRTMLIFDEVHRIKNPDGKRAMSALEIAKKAKFKYVLTGTPIPNSYRDIYNFLHILYNNEYNSFFGWNPDELRNPKRRVIEQINESMYPFFWRINKDDLQVPRADKDIIIEVEPSEEQKELAEDIYYNEKSSLAVLVRLIQASTNPALVNEKINYNELMQYDVDDSSTNGIVGNIDDKEFSQLLGKDNNSGKYNNNLAQTVSPKFSKGIEKVLELVSQGKKVLVWGVFVDTLLKITESLRNNGVKTNVVYGKTDKSERTELIDEFRDGDVQVLVSNPQTLGESISLHQTVHDAIYFEYNFNLTFMLQSRDRIHRLGLDPKQHTRYYYLQTKGENAYSNRPGFIDQKIHERLQDKEQTMYEAIDDKELSINYSESEINEAIKIIDAEKNRIEENHDGLKD